jgi:hypothetical protein
MVVQVSWLATIGIGVAAISLLLLFVWAICRAATWADEEDERDRDQATRPRR